MYPSLFQRILVKRNGHLPFVAIFCRTGFFRSSPDRRRGYALQTNDYNVGSGALFCGLDVIGRGTTFFPAVRLRPFFPKRSDFGKTLLSLPNLLRRVDGFCSDMGRTDNFKGIVYAILSSSTFGFAPFFTLMLIGGGLSSFEVLFYRWGVASLALGCFGLAVRQNFRIGWRDLGTEIGRASCRERV